jgi:hypothetical protein
MTTGVKRIFDLCSWGIPLVFYVMSWYIQSQYRYPMSNTVWKEYWHQFYYFYLLAGGVNVILYFESGQKTIKGTWLFFRAPIVGFLLTMFSYALAALSRDLLNVMFLLIFRTPLFMY